ncbi:MAG: ATP-dependent DNA helicase RecG [Ruminococcaceae bacterium]|nr:ATP-dependent DNA helicase RecG [Oscillospiraceae bacterium]
MAETDKEVRYLKGVGEARAKALGKLGIHTLRDLIVYFPRSYEDRTQFSPIMAAPLDTPVCIRAMVANTPTLARVKRGMHLVKLRAVDESGSVDITYFNQTWIRDQLKPGETYIFYGKLSGTLTHRSMANPDWEPEVREGQKTGRILPKYPLCSGVSNKQLMGYIRTALDVSQGDVPDSLPERIREQFGLVQARYAYENIHFPADYGALELARRRLIFEELFILGCAMGRLRGARQGLTGALIPARDMSEFYAALPFVPTGAQRRAVHDALDDMASGRPMNRLVQGDVGSGKTLVAAACAWAICAAGKQTAFMAPTEILAEQHLETLRGFTAVFGLRVEKLTGSMTAKEKRETKAALAAGEIDIIVGTHALITGDVEFSDLGLVITDEQHRFGVNQRSALAAKSQTPHVLVMSATPIPRTLALIIYGDLDVSVIDELPPGRQKVDTFTVDESYRTRLYGFIEKLVAEGRQVFVVCPMVEENEEYDPSLKSAVEHAQELSAAFPSLNVGCIHGKMKARDKDAVMADTLAGKINILVSTTVIEVGVDVPNAALMVIENAERFGLSQLHQLRGRVGRGQFKSWCILISNATNKEARQRLQAMCDTNDGFKISEEDLRLRGPGDFFGQRQHGLPEMHIADLCGDMSTLQTAQEAAKQLLARDPALAMPENARLAAQVDRLLENSLGAIS